MIERHARELKRDAHVTLEYSDILGRAIEQTLGVATLDPDSMERIVSLFAKAADAHMNRCTVSMHEDDWLFLSDFFTAIEKHAREELVALQDEEKALRRVADMELSSMDEARIRIESPNYHMSAETQLQNLAAVMENIITHIATIQEFLNQPKSINITPSAHN